VPEKTRPTPGKTRRSWAFRIGLGFLSALVALALVEAVARLAFAPPVFRANLGYDPELGFSAHPGSVVEFTDERGKFSTRLNSLGLRGPELPPPGAPKPDGVRRLVFAGDSFLYAQAVRDEELVSRATVRELATRGIRADEYNLTCTDYSTAQELLLLRKYGPDLRPDAVVLLLYPGNDVANNCLELAGKTRGNDGDYLRPYLDTSGTEVRYLHPVRAFLRNRLRSFALLEKQLLAATGARGWRPIQEGDLDLDESNNAALRQHEPGDDWDIAWQRTEGLLRVFRDEVRALGARFLVVVIPQRNQVQREAYNRPLYDPELAGGLDWNLPEKRLQAFFAREGIDALLLLEVLRAALLSDPGALYAPDFHLTGRAHVLAAQRIAAWAAGDASDELVSASFTQPVDLVSPERCPAFVDLASAPRFECLSEGWFPWRADWFGQGAGVAMGARSVILLRNCGGDLLVRGSLPRKALGLPWTLELALDGRALAQSFPIPSPGPFEIRVRAEELPPEGAPLAEVALLVRETASAEGNRRAPWTLVVHQVGFQCAGEASR